MLSSAEIESGMREISLEDREVPGTQAKDKGFDIRACCPSKDLRNHSRKSSAVLGNASPAENELRGLWISLCPYPRTQCLAMIHTPV